MTHVSMLRRWAFVLLASSFIAGCVSKSPAHTYERRNELYESIATPGTRLVQATAQYLQRVPLYLDSQDIPDGVYKPTEVARLISNSSACSLNAMNLTDAILTGNTSAYTRSQPALPPIPVEKTALEIMNEQARNSSFEGARTSTRTPSANCELCASSLGGGCDNSESHATTPELASANLRYVVVVTNTSKCCHWRTQSRTRDVLLLQAEKEMAQYKVSAAAITYDNKEILQLLQLLPVKYRAVADSELALPAALSAFVSNLLQSTASTIASRFPAQEQRAAKITFDITLMNRRNDIDYGAWYQSLSNEDEALVYLSPLLARAPFYLCYNQGVEQFLRSRSNLIARVSGNRWRNLSKEEIILAAEQHVKFNDEFASCVTAQLTFILAHEVGHKYVLELGKRPPTDVIVERLADCFGLANAKLGGGFDPFVFENLVATDPAASDEVTARLKLRMKKLHDMNKYFDTTSPPKDGKKLVTACRNLVLENVSPSNGY